MTTYDKIEWHMGKDDETPDSKVVSHFRIIMEWLKDHNMLTDEGVSDLEVNWGPDFSITDEQLTPQGQEFMKDHYQEWLSSLTSNSPHDTKTLDEYLTWH